MILSYQTMRFVLGTHFHCPPHAWDDQPFDRVMLDYMFVQAVQQKQSDEMEKRQKEMKRQYNSGNNKGGRVIRTTSDAGELEDYFDRINAEMRENDGSQGVI